MCGEREQTGGSGLLLLLTGSTEGLFQKERRNFQSSREQSFQGRSKSGGVLHSKLVSFSYCSYSSYIYK